jgi:hypothetical protein
MASPDENPQTPGGPKQEEDTSDYDTKVTEARLTSPMGCGEPIEFDPDTHEPPLSDEEFDELTRESGESGGPKPKGG